MSETQVRRRKRGNGPDIHLNLNVRGLGQSATLAINERSAELAASGHQVYRFGLGQSPFPVPAPVEAELKNNAHQKDYLPVRGLRSLREAVADFHRRTQGVEFTADDILIGPGSKELMFILQLVYYGDLVIPTPSWVSYAPQAHIIGRQIRWVETRAEHDWRLLAEDLEALCARDPTRPRILILNYPNNPSKELGEVLKHLTPRGSRADVPTPFDDPDEDPFEGMDRRTRRIAETLLHRRRLFHQARRRITDAETTGFVFVLTPERLPILETHRAMHALQQFDIPLCGAIVNRVLPPEADGEFLRRRREQEARYLEEIPHALHGMPTRHVPMLPEDIQGLDSLRAVAAHLDRLGI